MCTVSKNLPYMLACLIVEFNDARRSSLKSNLLSTFFSCSCVLEPSFSICHPIPSLLVIPATWMLPLEIPFNNDNDSEYWLSTYRALGISLKARHGWHHLLLSITCEFCIPILQMRTAMLGKSHYVPMDTQQGDTDLGFECCRLIP